MNTEEALRVAKTLALRAGARVLAHYQTDLVVTEKKEVHDGREVVSPLTAADLEANKIIMSGLQGAFPDVPVVSEETEDDKSRFGAEAVWVIDPIDGTKEFVKGLGDFTINIALLVDDEPVLGVVYAPVHDDLYAGIVGIGATLTHAGEEESISVSDTRMLADAVGVRSRNHATSRDKAFMSVFRDAKVVGSSLKGCLVARGVADAYARFGPQSEWDVAAMMAVVLAAGGRVSRLDGTPLVWNTRDFRVHGFVISNGLLHDSLLERVAL